MSLSPSRIVPGLLFGLFALTGCTQERACALIGDWQGAFYGDAEGDLVISVIDSDTPDEAIVQVSLEGLGYLVEGTGFVGCTDGAFDLKLADENGDEIGDFGGNLIDGTSGDGEWSFGTGESGTWDATAPAAE